MSLKSKKTLVEVVIGLLLAIGYLVYALSPVAPLMEETNRWAIMMLATMGIGVGAMILTEVAFNVGYVVVLAHRKQHEPKEKQEIKEEIEQSVEVAFKEDEMDKQISFKIHFVAMGIIGTALIVALFLIAFNIPLMICMNVVFASCVAGMLVDAILKIVLSEKGLRLN